MFTLAIILMMLTGALKKVDYDVDGEAMHPAWLILFVFLMDGITFMAGGFLWR